MPELPEVETIVQKLKTVLPGKVITSIDQFHIKTFHGETTDIVGQKITDVSRRAKIIRIHFPDQKNIIIHLKMTGQLIYQDAALKLGGGHPTADWVLQLPSKHTRLAFHLHPEATLFFNDQRLFGWIKVVSDEEIEKIYAGLGPDAHDPSFTTEYLYPLLQRKRVPIKVALMDNRVVAGAGNIYAAEALNLAQISPLRPAHTLSKKEVAKLVETTQEVIKRGIELGGTTFDGKYVDTEGLAGKYQSVVRVYGRAGKACLWCGSEIVKTTVGGRGTYYCSSCQI